MRARSRVLRPHPASLRSATLPFQGRDACGTTSLRLRFLVTWQDVISAFPRRQKIEIAELLREAHRVVDHAFDLVVPAHLDESGKREVLAQRVSLEPVIREDAAQ